MSIFQDTFVALAQFIKLNEDLLTTKDKVIDADRHAQRNVLISQLVKMQEDVAKLGETLAATVKTARTIRSSEISLMEKMIKGQPSYATAAVANTVPQPIAEVKIGNYLRLPATGVQSFRDVPNDGKLYFTQGHFAIRICGHLFHGGIGKIYLNEPTPVKIKECRTQGACPRMNQCRYYHDPAKYPGSTDVRNFIARSWVYTPPKDRSTKYGRTIGAGQSLETDIIGVTNEELSRMKDQIIHDLLVYMVAVAGVKN